MLPFDSAEPLDRRTFLGALAGGVATLGILACDDRSATAAAAPWARRPGVQLYTVRSLMERDLGGTLAAIAGIGYREVETAGLFGFSPEAFRAELDRHGLVSPAAHTPIQALRENLDRTLASAQALGQQWVVVPWLDESERTAEAYRRVAADLNRFGAAAGERGLRVGYHNHEFEFEPLEGGVRGYDILLAETDPDLVDIELDLFWVVKGGQDPVALFERDPGRFRMCHVKDMTDRAGAGSQVPVGDGEIDFARIFAHADRAGLRHYFVEQDDPADPLESIRKGHGHLQRLMAGESRS
jgi:sugar phosphate isomerase/epimerase